MAFLTFDEKVAIQPGLLRSHVFSASDLFSVHGNDIASWRTIDPQNRFLDTTRLACGKPSLRFQCDPFKGSDSAGQWGCRFTPGPPPGRQFGPGEFFTYQYMYCVDRFMFEHNFEGNNGNFKLSMVGAGDYPTCSTSNNGTAFCPGTCTDIEIVTTNFNWGYQFPQIYNSCYTFAGLQGRVSDVPSDWTDQPHYQPAPGTQAQVCSNQYIGSSGAFSAHPNDLALYIPGVQDYRPFFRNCVTWFDGLANPTDQITRWGTFTVEVTLGTVFGPYRPGDPSYPNKPGTRLYDCHVDAWLHWLGDPNPAQKFIDHTQDFYGLDITPPGSPSVQKYGRLWLLNYMTGKSATENHQSASSWYANVIIADQPIPKETADVSGGGASSLALVRL